MPVCDKTVTAIAIPPPPRHPETTPAAPYIRGSLGIFPSACRHCDVGPQRCVNLLVESGVEVRTRVRRETGAADVAISCCDSGLV